MLCDRHQKIFFLISLPTMVPAILDCVDHAHEKRPLHHNSIGASTSGKGGRRILFT